MNKQELRQHIRNLKKYYSPEQLRHFSNKTAEEILFMEGYIAKTILFYSPLPDEVDVSWLYESELQKTDKVLMPKVVGDDIEIRIYDLKHPLERGAFGIMEPTGPIFTDYDSIDCVLVPGMAFDKAGHRLGRGKGYYDRLLPKLKNAYKIGVCFPFQFLDEIPHEPHDVLMDCIVYGSQINPLVKKA